MATKPLRGHPRARKEAIGPWRSVVWIILLLATSPWGLRTAHGQDQTEADRLASSLRQVEEVFNQRGVSKGLIAVEELATENPERNDVLRLVAQLRELSDLPIVFVSRQGGRQRIYSAHVDGTHLTCLTPDQGTEDMPMFSPDGGVIAFRSERSGNQDIWTMNADGSEPRRLTDNSDKDSGPTWSPDGSRILYAAKQRGEWSLWSMNADGTDKRMLIDDAGGGSLSPDGDRLVFSRGWPPQIWLADAEGGEQTQLTSGGATNASPTWTWDGKQIAFLSTRGGRVSIYTMDASGKNQIDFVKGPANNGGRASFSAKGEWMCFFSDRDGQQQLYVMSTDGRLETRVLPSDDDRFTPYLGRVKHNAVVSDAPAAREARERSLLPNDRFTYEELGADEVLIRKGFPYRDNVQLGDHRIVVAKVEGGLFIPDEHSLIPMDMMGIGSVSFYAGLAFVPICVSEDKQQVRKESLVDAIGVTWIFSEPGMSFSIGSSVMETKREGASISFTNAGVVLKGFRFRTE